MKQKARIMTRAQFEKRIPGEWIEKRTEMGSFRVNGKFITAVQGPDKLFSDGKRTVRAPSWRQIWNQIKL